LEPNNFLRGRGRFWELKGGHRVQKFLDRRGKAAQSRTVRSISSSLERGPSSESLGKSLKNGGSKKGNIFGL